MTMTMNLQNLQRSAAEALAASVPTVSEVRSVAYDAFGNVPVGADQALVASFIGASSADLVLILPGIDTLAAGPDGGGPSVSREDMARALFEAATTVLGAGVLGEVTMQNASSLFADEEFAVFELSGDLETVGTFAIRVRSDSVSVPDSRPQPSVVNKLGRIHNVEMALTVEIGRTRMSVRDVLGLEPGGVIELDRSAGAPADVLLNGRLIAHGEVVVVDQDYAVRITQILDAVDGPA